jgi:hypothetical protein
MAKSISRTEKRTRGRPATNPTSIHLTLAPDPLAEVDRWIAKQKEPGLSRPEAIRRLIEIGLKAKADVSVLKPGRNAQSPPDHVRAAADRAAARSKERKP